jgi:hypothetical protein
VEHLVLQKCTIESLKPILDSNLQGLSLIDCDIKRAETGKNLMKLKYLVVRKTSGFFLRIPLPLKYLEYRVDSSILQDDIFDKVTDILYITIVETQELVANIQAHTLFIDCLSTTKLSASVKHLYLLHGVYVLPPECPQVETLLIHANDLDVSKFPNVRHLHVDRSRPTEKKLGDRMPKLEQIDFYGEPMFSVTDRPEVKVVYHEGDCNVRDFVPYVVK